MARRRTVSDEEILEATARAVAREGPLRFTLADVGRELGVSAPAILKRFETKRALLLAMSADSRAKVPDVFSRRDDEPALDALHRGLREHTRGMSTPREIANGLGFLAIDMTDAEFRGIALGFFDSFRAAIEGLLIDAMAEKELARCDTAELSRAIEVAFNGSVVTWGVRQDGSCAAALARDVEAVLAPFRTRRRGPAARLR